MQKLRKLYKETQRNSVQNFDLVTAQRVKNIHAFAVKEEQTMAAKNDFINYDELVFYRDKMKAVSQVFDESVKQGFKKSKVQNDCKIILQQNYNSSNQAQRAQNDPFSSFGQERISIGQTGSLVQNRKSGQGNKDLLASFLDNKKNQVVKSQVGLRSLIQQKPFVPKNYAVKEVQLPHGGGERESENKKNNQKMAKMQEQIDRLRKQLDKKQGEEFNAGLLQIQVQKSKFKINQLQKKLQRAKQYTQTLERSNNKDYNNQKTSNYAPSSIYKPYKHQESLEQGPYNPYQIKYKNNDIAKVKSKWGFEVDNSKYKNDNLGYGNENVSQKRSNGLDIFEQFEQSDQERDKSFRSVPELKFNQQQKKDQLRNISIRSKMSFFKPDIVIYRSKEFDVAVKSYQCIGLQKQKINIYVNNNTSQKQFVKIKYTVDQKYYNLTYLQNLEYLEPKKQGKEQIQVKLVFNQNFDRTIPIAVSVGSKNIDFLVPAMFIQFSQKRPILDKKDSINYQKIDLKPFNQFFTIDSAVELIPFDKEYGFDQNPDIGKIYAVSKYHQGYIFLRWKKGGYVQVQTIKPWINFISYLVSRIY